MDKTYEIEKGITQQQNKYKKIYYSKTLISAVKELVEIFTKSIGNRQLLKNYYLYYLDVPSRMEQIKSVLSNIEIHQIIKKQKNPRILEIGSGIGICCLITRAFTDAEVVGVEPAPGSYGALQNCITELKEANQHLPYISLNCGGEAIPYDNNSFDLIYSFEVLEHVENPRKVLEEIYRILKPGAYAYISTCNYDSFYEGHYKRFWNPFIGVKGNRKNYINKGLSPKFLSELNFITKKQIKRWTKEIGYTDLKFNPGTTNMYDNYMVKSVFPTGFRMPVSESVKPILLIRMLEQPKVKWLLSQIDREYKLYFMVKK